MTTIKKQFTSVEQNKRLYCKNSHFLFNIKVSKIHDKKCAFTIPMIIIILTVRLTF